MTAVCIVGVQWGDEGKGKVIDFFAQEMDCVARWAGGSNAGHTIRIPDGREFVLHLLPGGVFKPAAVNVIGNGVVVDPWQLLKEVDALDQARVERREDWLRLSDRAHLVLPWHQALDQAREQGRGRVTIGTTGRGIGPCYEDKVARRGVRLGDLRRPAELPARLADLARERNLLLAHYGREPIDPEGVAADLRAAGERLLPWICDTGRFLRESLATGRRVLFEGAQGVLLDLDHGTYPFVTSSSSSPAGVPAGLGVPGRTLTDVVGVAKAYSTRVGEGPFPSELSGAAGERLRQAGREYGATTGRPRRCGWFDAVAVRYAVELAGVTELFLTKLDVLAGLGPLPVVTGYRGRDGFPAGVEDLAAVEPVLTTLPGWEGSLQGLGRWADLPDGAKEYVDRIEELVGVPVGKISHGPGRNEVLTR